MQRLKNIKNIVNDFKKVAPSVDFWSLRLVLDIDETLSVRENIVQPPHMNRHIGAFITIVDEDSYSYAATCELNKQGFADAIQKARSWAQVSGQSGLIKGRHVYRPQQSGRYETPVQHAWQSTTMGDKIALLQDVNQALNIHDCIVDWQATLGYRNTTSVLVTSDDIEIEQCFHYVLPGCEAVANQGSQTQRRTGGGWGTVRQGGLELLTGLQFPVAANQVAEEAVALLHAPDCPTETASLLLTPSQMMLQIHESIGHPLEMDRILGDERNFAGTSFVHPDMCGSYQYGSELLNVTFDPSLATEMTSYGFDDDGTPAERTYIIRNGKLERLLGSATSQARAGLPGIANARACDWNRPPIDRMANLNVEPGNHSMEELIKTVENGVLMDANLSWSIDDSRNKFQFGCELGRLIKDGELKGLVKNPNYRGISATFWRNLAAVGDESTFEIWGTPYCGKGEPQQVIFVGHASPACVFHDVEIFGGD
jgi:predicted Zn-dependent protease